MPPPTFQGAHLLGAAQFQTGNDWPSSRTITSSMVDGFPPGCSLLMAVMSSGTHASGPPTWSPPSPWQLVQQGGGGADTGSSIIFANAAVFHALNTPSLFPFDLTPSHNVTAGFPYWWVVMTAWSPAYSHGDSNTRPASGNSGVVAESDYSIDGRDNGTFVNFAVMSPAYNALSTVHTANGFTVNYDNASGGNCFRVASKQFTGGDVSQPQIRYNKSNYLNAYAGTVGLVLDVPPRRRGGRHLGLVRGSRGVG